MKSLNQYINESNKVELISDGNEHGYDYVDLGLPSGTMWATCNVGADKPEDAGLLFQFGRVDGYRYGDKNHKFRTSQQNKQDTGDEYVSRTTSGKMYKSDDVLLLKDDAARVNMGGPWFMPNKKHCKELCDHTKHEVTKVNGVNGMLFTSNINGHRLFIPFIQGFWDGYNNKYDKATSWFSADIWSSQVHTFNNNDAYTLYCTSDGYLDIASESCTCAFPVRGVFNK